MGAVLLAASVGGCAGTAASGLTRAPAHRRSVEAAFVCDGERLVLTEDSIGPALLVGDRALENHWRAGGADHFVSWEYRRGRHVALEYEISTDRTTITRREYDRKQGATYHVTASQDGVWRVTGEPTADLPCEGPAIAVRSESTR